MNAVNDCKSIRKFLRNILETVDLFTQCYNILYLMKKRTTFDQMNPSSIPGGPRKSVHF